VGGTDDGDDAGGVVVSPWVNPDGVGLSDGCGDGTTQPVSSKRDRAVSGMSRRIVTSTSIVRGGTSGGQDAAVTGQTKSTENAVVTNVKIESKMY
jgi:hypothetical protein